MLPPLLLVSINGVCAVVAAAAEDIGFVIGSEEDELKTAEMRVWPVTKCGKTYNGI